MLFILAFDLLADYVCLTLPLLGPALHDAPIPRTGPMACTCRRRSGPCLTLPKTAQRAPALETAAVGAVVHPCAAGLDELADADPCGGAGHGHELTLAADLD